MNTKPTTTTKATTKAKAEAKAEATTADAVAVLSAVPTAAEAVSLAVRGATTTAQYLAAATKAATFVAEAEADAFDAIVAGRGLIGEALYGAYKANLLAADANTKVKPASDLTWTTVAGGAFPTGKGTKAAYEALSDRARPVARSWSALSEDWSVFTVLSDGRWRAAYDLSRGESAPSVRGYLTFARQAEAAAKAEAGDKGTPQSRGAITKAAAKAEADRQAKAKADAKAKRERDAKAAADARIEHITVHPSASVVAGFPALSGADLTACTDPAVLSALAAVVTAWHDHVVAAKAEAKAKGTADPFAAPGADPAPEAEAEAAPVTVPAPDPVLAAMIAAAVREALAAA